jgi:hypothetical protein
MKAKIGILALMLVVALVARSQTKPSAPQQQPAVVSGESLAVVKAFIRSEMLSPGETVNLALMMGPLGLRDSSFETCLKGLSFKKSDGAGGTLPNELTRYKIRLVPEDGIQAIAERIAKGERDNIWRLSGVAFDDSGRFAIIGKNLYCGTLCAEWELVIFQKVNGKWRRSKRQCLQVVS